jgi:phosphate transport system permease protein
MLKETSSQLVKRRTLKENIFKVSCRLTTFFYLVIVSFFLFLIIKSGIGVFLAVKIKVDSLETMEIVAPKLSNSTKNKALITKFNEELTPVWLHVKGNFGSYYKNKESYNKKWNETIETLKENGLIKVRSSFIILKNTDSSAQDSAGLKGAIKGTLMVVFIFISFASVIGIATGIYLTEFSKNKTLQNIIMLNISNLASIPPIIYGIFGINFLINILFIPRSSSLLGGLILGLLTLPIVIIVTSDALRSVPSHIKFSAKALGLTEVQTVFRVCVPYSFPRILTGILLTLSRGINEATPLILVGMASFIQSPPTRFSDPATTIATQIYLWVTNPDESFMEKAFGSIFILLIIVGSINLFASLIRYRVMKKISTR